MSNGRTWVPELTSWLGKFPDQIIASAGGYEIRTVQRRRKTLGIDPCRKLSTATGVDMQPLTPEDAAKLMQMRNPTPEMIMAGIAKLHLARQSSPAEAIKEIFKAMVDRALSPRQGA